jgi:hypothetical protein
MKNLKKLISELTFIHKDGTKEDFDTYYKRTMKAGIEAGKRLSDISKDVSDKKPIKLPRQLKSSDKEMLIVKDSKVVTIDKTDWNKYKSKGWLQAESVDLTEAFDNKFIDDDSNNWGESESISFGRKMGYKEVGVTAPKSNPVSYMILFELNSYDKKDVAGAKLKAGERIYRYSSSGTRIGKMLPLVKININLGMIYFLTVESFRGEIDEPVFETKGEKMAFLRMMKGHG